ncbi:hypothetical protein [Actinomadura meridiana]|uniref:hypothetical protein n=1 Tax=Actinomadura meridiana TaxID=559626 RepID=UPI0031E9E00B
MADPFTIDDSLEGTDRYAADLRRVRFTFLDTDDNLTRDPIKFTIEAFQTATSRSAYDYVSFSSPIAWARCYRVSPEGPLRAYVRVMTRPIEPLVELDGWSGWEFRDGGLCEPTEEQIEKVPAMCTSTLLLFAVPVGSLHVPLDTPEELTVQDAAAAVAALVAVLNERVGPVLARLEGGR